MVALSSSALGKPMEPMDEAVDCERAESEGGTDGAALPNAFEGGAEGLPSKSASKESMSTVPVPKVLPLLGVCVAVLL